MSVKYALAVAAVAVMGLGSAVRPTLADVPAGPGATSQPAHRFAHGPFERLEKLRQIMADLNLTDDQKGKIKEIVAPYRKELEAWRDAHQTEIDKAKADMQSAREAKDRTKIQAAVAEIRALFESAPKPKGLLEQIEAILTPDQLEKFKGQIADLRAERGEHRHAQAGGSATPAATK